MRKEIRDVASYEKATIALKNLIITFQKELSPIANAWTERKKNTYTGISWYDPSDYDNMPSFYGTEPGMYYSPEVGDYMIWFPRTTQAYVVFRNAFLKLYQAEDDLIERSIPSDIEIFYNGYKTIEFKFMTYIFDVTDEMECAAAKLIAEDIKEMLMGFDGFETFDNYEGDGEPGEEHVYNPEEELPANYYVGVKSKYNLWDF